MNLKQFLKKHPIINKSQLARQLWPEKKGVSTRLNQKINSTNTGTGIQRITEKELEAVKSIIRELAADAETIQA
jgi:hypothetical protein